MRGAGSQCKYTRAEGFVSQQEGRPPLEGTFACHPDAPPTAMLGRTHKSRDTRSLKTLATLLTSKSALSGRVPSGVAPRLGVRNRFFSVNKSLLKIIL